MELVGSIGASASESSNFQKTYKYLFYSIDMAWHSDGMALWKFSICLFLLEKGERRVGWSKLKTRVFVVLLTSTLSQIFSPLTGLLEFTLFRFMDSYCSFACVFFLDLIKWTFSGGNNFSSIEWWDMILFWWIVCLILLDKVAPSEQYTLVSTCSFPSLWSIIFFLFSLVSVWVFGAHVHPETH